MRILIIAALAVFALVFQNCTKSIFDSKEREAPAQFSAGGNYDGKTFVLLAPRACPDGARIEMQISAHGGSFVLERENCAEKQSPEILSESSLVKDTARAEFLIYAGQLLHHQVQSAPVTVCDFSVAAGSSRRMIAIVQQENSGLVGRAVLFENRGGGFVLSADSGFLPAIQVAGATMPEYLAESPEQSSSFKIYSRRVLGAEPSYPSDANSKLELRLMGQTPYLEFANCREL